MQRLCSLLLILLALVIAQVPTADARAKLTAELKTPHARTLAPGENADWSVRVGPDTPAGTTVDLFFDPRLTATRISANCHRTPGLGWVRCLTQPGSRISAQITPITPQNCASVPYPHACDIRDGAPTLRFQAVLSTRTAVLAETTLTRELRK